MIANLIKSLKKQTKTVKLPIFAGLLLLLLIGVFITPAVPNVHFQEVNNVNKGQADSVQINAKIYLPRISQPALVLKGNAFQVVVNAPADSASWQAILYREYRNFSLSLSDITYNTSTGRWNLNATVSPSTAPDLYDLQINFTSSGGTVLLTEWNAVAIYDSFPEDFNIIHISDTHLTMNPSHRDNQLRYTIHEANLMNADLIIITGDLVESPSNTAFNNFKSCIRSSRIPVFLCPGNHDLPGPEYQDVFGPDYYTFEFGDLFVIMANSGNDAFFGEVQIAQIEQDLIDHSSAKYKILAFHYPVWGISTAGEFGNATDWHGRPQLFTWLDDYQDIRDICYEQGVDLVLHGHNHNDQVTMDNGTLHIMTTVNGGVCWDPMGKFWGYRPLRFDNYSLTSWSWWESHERSWSQPIRWENGSLKAIVQYSRSPIDFYDINPGLYFKINNYREVPLVNQSIEVIVTPLVGDYYVAEEAELSDSINGTDGWLLRFNSTIPASSSKTIRVYPSNPSAPTFVGADLSDPWSGWHLEFTANFTNPVSGINYAGMRYSENGGAWKTVLMSRLSTEQFYYILDPYSTGDVLEVRFRAYDYSGLEVESQIFTLEIVPKTNGLPTDMGLVSIAIIGATVTIIIVVVIVVIWRRRRPS